MKSYEDLIKDDFQELWIFLHNFVQKMSEIDDVTPDKELLACYKCILNLVDLAINSTSDLMSIFNKHNNLLKTMLIFQKLYKTNIDEKVNIEI